MGMSRAQKEAEVKELQDTFANDELIVVTHYSGLNVSKMQDLRGKLREAGGRFKVTKNSLAKIAIKGSKFEPQVSHPLRIRWLRPRYRSNSPRIMTALSFSVARWAKKF